MKVDSAIQTHQIPPAQSGSSGNLRHAAEQFEALFVGQMLRSVRESATDETDDDSGANSPFLELAEEQLAQAMAARGGLGIATMVMTDLGQAK
jgi:peptidoglycan hydrolase FlgJ